MRRRESLERLIKIHLVFYRNYFKVEKITKLELADIFGCSERTIRRDIRFLERLGAPIMFEQISNEKYIFYYSYPWRMEESFARFKN